MFFQKSEYFFQICKLKNRCGRYRLQICIYKNYFYFHNLLRIAWYNKLTQIKPRFAAEEQRMREFEERERQLKGKEEQLKNEETKRMLEAVEQKQKEKKKERFIKKIWMKVLFFGFYNYIMYI